MSTIRGLIFDMDGVLLDTEKIYFHCWLQSAKELGYPMSEEAALHVRSCCAAHALPYFRQLYGENFDYFKVRDRRRELVSQYIAEHGVEQKSGIAELLQFCRESGLPYAIATATSKELAEQRLELAGLAGQFPQIVGGDQVLHGKPDPDIYLVAAKVLHLPPDQCMAIEDSPNGITAGLSAHCNVILVPDLTPPEAGDRDRLFGIAENLKEVIPLLQAAGIGEKEHAKKSCIESL